MKPIRTFTEEDWQATPKSVREAYENLESWIEQLSNLVEQHAGQIKQLTEQVNKLTNQTNKNSKNSSKPPSSDPPFKKPPKETRPKNGKKRKRGGQKGHAGHQQELLPPTHEKMVMPTMCSCGCSDFNVTNFKPFYTHQVIELPRIELDVTHFVLHKGQCPKCKKTVKATVPFENRTGYGPRMTATIAELSGTYGSSRDMIKDICRNIFGFHISIGTIQKVIDRASHAIEPVYNRIGEMARLAPVNHIDETSWFQNGLLRWLWVMVNHNTAFFKIHQNRSMEAFKSLIAEWSGILVSDGYGVYRKWVGLRQTCLAHLIRDARNLAERDDESIKRFGVNILDVLTCLCHFAKKPPTKKQWEDCYTKLILFIFLFEGADDDAGKFAKRLFRELDNLFTFLEEEGVDPTNNRAERVLRFGVLWRKRCMGTQSDKGDRWVERILSIKQTCKLKLVSSFDVLFHSIDSNFKEQTPCLEWLG